MLAEYHRWTVPRGHVQQRREAPRDRLLRPFVEQVEQRACIDVLHTPTKLVEVLHVLEWGRVRRRSLRKREERDVKDIPDEEGGRAGVAIAIEVVAQVDKVPSYITPDDGRGGVSTLHEVA